MESINQLWSAPWAQPLLGMVLLAGLLALVWWRAGSFFSLLDHLWHLVAGRTDVNDPTMKAMLLTSRDLERFRFTYRIKVHSLTDVQKLHSWCQRHDVDVAALSKAGEWVDVDTPAILKPTPRRLLSPWVMVVVEVMVMYAFVLFLATGAVLKTKNSEIHFFLHEQTFSHWTQQWTVEVSACSSDIARVAEVTGFTSAEAALICRLLTDGLAKDVIAKYQPFQAGVLWVSLVLLFLMAYSDVRRIFAFKAARALGMRISKQEASEPVPQVEP